jgi:sugar phosphate permease
VASLQAWGTEIAGSASGTQSMMRYVGSVAGAAIMAAVLGAHPGIAEMRTLLWIIALVAVANLVLALGAFRRGPSAAKLPAPATA